MNWDIEFAKNEAELSDGFNHSGIEHYMDRPVEANAREGGQNSGDERADSNKPVVLKFNQKKVPVTEIPGWSNFKKSLECCLEKVKKLKNKKAIGFFRNAKKLADAEAIDVLEMADYNTRGLIGPCKEGHPFHALLKGTGESIKESTTSGGSFGIGKFAAFAISQLRTVFYSTIYIDGQKKKKYLAMGRSILISFDEINKTKYRGEGYWGQKHFLPVSNPKHAPSWLDRKESGTSVFALGFNASGDWQYLMAIALIRNFFVAIHRGEMEFHIDDGKLKLTKRTLAKYFRDTKIKECAESASVQEQFDHAYHLYQCLVATEATTEELEIPSLGKVTVRLLLREDYPKCISIIRNGMVITETLEHFGHSFSRFPGYKDFIAIVEPVSTEGKELIKSLENARHDSLSAERLIDPVEQERAVKAMKLLGKKIREVIRKKALSAPSKLEGIEELADFFSVEDPKEQLPDKDSNETNPETFTSQARGTSQTTTRTRSGSGTGSGQGAGGGGGTGSGQGAGGGGGTGSGQGAGGGSGSGLGQGTGGGSGHGSSSGGGALEISAVRNLVLSPCKRKIWFTPSDSGPVTLALKATGLDVSTYMTINATTHGQVSDEKLALNVTAGSREEIELTLSENYRGPVELVVVN